MDKKRFELNTLNDYIIDNEGINYRIVDDYDMIKIVNLLNTLADNNQQLKKENKELNQIIETICDDYEEAHGMDIRNSDWFSAW